MNDSLTSTTTLESRGKAKCLIPCQMPWNATHATRLPIQGREALCPIDAILGKPGGPSSHVEHTAGDLDVCIDQATGVTTASHLLGIH